jgi:8-oxo-dGTP pyrophosphatase MutT (NUDIX family)
MKKIEYITLTWKSTPITNNNIVKFNCVTAIIKNKDTWLYLALEFIREEFWLVWWKLEDWENKGEAIIREVEEETGYSNAKILDIIFEEIFSRWYKARKDREEEALDKVFFVEVEEENKTEILWADIWTKWIFWFNKNEMLEKLTLTHHIYFFEEYLNKK